MAEPEGKEIGTVVGYYDHVKVIAIELTAPLKVGDKIQVKGATTDFTLTVNSMQIEHESVESAKKGDSVGIKVPERSRKNDKVYKVE
jgi:putative protease|tara:strand:+ start:28 stop:288 length:261 start_codon:yes stop_codon:yes gene_type:complete